MSTTIYRQFARLTVHPDEGGSFGLKTGIRWMMRRRLTILRASLRLQDVEWRVSSGGNIRLEVWGTMSEWPSPASLNAMFLANETWDRIEGEQTDKR